MPKLTVRKTSLDEPIEFWLEEDEDENDTILIKCKKCIGGIIEIFTICDISINGLTRWAGVPTELEIETELVKTAKGTTRKIKING